MEAINVVRRLATIFEVDAVPALVNLCIDSPEVSEGGAIVGALQFETNERSFVKEAVDKELGLIKYTDMVSLVGDLEVAITCS